MFGEHLELWFSVFFHYLHSTKFINNTSLDMHIIFFFFCTYSEFTYFNLIYYLHSIFNNVLAIFGVPLLFVAWHSNVLKLSVLLPSKSMLVVFLPIMLVLSLFFMYQVITGGGAAFLFTSHLTFITIPSFIGNGLSCGSNETFWTATVKCVYL